MNSQQVQTPDGINWHVESIQSKGADSASNVENIILIPSGEGDCQNLVNLALALASTAPSSTKITTFDMPGFSRSTAPIEAYDKISPPLIAKQIITLLDTLGITSPVTFFGCSSGGGTTLALLCLYQARVKCGIVHEVPLACPPPFLEWPKLSDTEIINRCTPLFEAWHESENDGKAKHAALGPEYFKRREKNFLTWIRHLVTNFEEATHLLATPERLRQRPLFWTVGALSPREWWELDFTVGKEAGIEVRTDVLNCMHFPATTMPEETSKWIWECIGKASS